MNATRAILRSALIAPIAACTLLAACQNTPEKAAPDGAAHTSVAGSPSSAPSMAVPPAVSIQTASEHVRFQVELAQTPRERARGLMFREHLAADHGMLFIFDHESHQSFWMKNTLIPLDMLFIDRMGRVVGIVENAEPKTRSPRAVDGNSQYVLELAGGTARTLGIKAGDTAVFEGVPGHPAGLQR